jgi:multidrug efflux pump subunit AcrB
MSESIAARHAVRLPQIGGEYDKTKSGFVNLAQVLIVSPFAIFLALVFQFNNAIKPLLVLIAAP